MIVQASIGNQASVHALRLVSRAFYQAANPHFSAYIYGPFGRYRTDDSWGRYIEKIRVCGPYIRHVDLRSSFHINEYLMELIGDCCPNVERVTFSFQEYHNKVPDYHTLLKKWSSANPNGNNIGHGNKIKEDTALIDMNGEGRAIDKLEKGLDSIREYLTGMTELVVRVVESMYYEDIDEEVPNLKPLSWQTFKGFFQSFPSLTSFSMGCPFGQWSQMPPEATITLSEGRVNEKETNFPHLTKLTLHMAELDLSIIRRLNLIFPRLEDLRIFGLVSLYSGDNGPGGQGEGGGASSLLIPRATTSVNLTLKRMWIHTAHADEVHKLLRLAPVLKQLTCYVLRARGNLAESHDDILTAPNPFGDRRWDVLRLHHLSSHDTLDLNLEFENTLTTILSTPNDENKN